MKILIVGGVAGGASAATRARRMNAQAQITILEKGPVISFANCGLPYHIGGEIANREKLLVASPELFWKRFRIEVKTHHEVLAIDRERKVISVNDHRTGQVHEMQWDRLILSTGSEPILPDACSPMPTNAFHLWTLGDMDRIMAHIDRHQPRSAVVLGGGFVGLEVVEQLHRRGLRVANIERNPQLLKPLDLEMAMLVQQHMREHGIELRLSQNTLRLICEQDVVRAIEIEGNERLDCDLLIVATGIRPRTGLASAAGLRIGPTGGVSVNSWMQSSDPNIYAVGDIAELIHGVSGETMRVPLAGPANRAGRIAGEHAATGNASPMGKAYGTAVVRVFDVTAACTGFNQSSLQARGIPYRSVIIEATHHASYYPGAQAMQLKLLYAPETGKILGGQAVGAEGVDKRIDIIATAMHFGGSVYDLANVDLTYAPPFGSAKDPVHLAAFAACNDLQSSPQLLPPDADLGGYQILDVRTSQEQAALPLANAIRIEVDALSESPMPLNPLLPTVVVCHSGKRAHVGACRLRGQGFQQVYNLSGGMSIRSLLEHF